MCARERVSIVRIVNRTNAGRIETGLHQRSDDTVDALPRSDDVMHDVGFSGPAVQREMGGGRGRELARRKRSDARRVRAIGRPLRVQNEAKCWCMGARCGRRGRIALRGCCRPRQENPNDHRHRGQSHRVDEGAIASHRPQVTRRMHAVDVRCRRRDGAGTGTVVRDRLTRSRADAPARPDRSTLCPSDISPCIVARWQSIVRQVF